MSELAPLPAAPRLARAVAAVPEPVPPFTNGRTPDTSDANDTAPGVQLAPSNRMCWFKPGALEETLTPRMRATVVLLVPPVTSPASVPEKFVPPPATLVRPAPFPMKLPTKRLAELGMETTPLNVLEPLNV